jgi:hypothetical protein
VKNAVKRFIACGYFGNGFCACQNIV